MRAFHRTVEPRVVSLITVINHHAGAEASDGGAGLRLGLGELPFGRARIRRQRHGRCAARLPRSIERLSALVARHGTTCTSDFALTAAAPLDELAGSTTALRSEIAH